MLKRLKGVCFRGILCLVVFGAVLEMAARIDDKVCYNAPFFSQYDYTVLVDRDEENIRRNVPNGRFEKWKINSLGFRGPEIELEKKNGRTRVVCLGASETFGLYETYNKEWPAQLRDMISREFENVEVINGSVVGLSFNNRIRYFEKYVSRPEPDVVIIYPNFYEYAKTSGAEERKDKLEPKGERKTEAKIIESVMSNIRVRPKLAELGKRCLPWSLREKLGEWKMRKEVRDIAKRALEGKKPSDVVPEQNVRAFESDLRKLVLYIKGKGLMPVLSTYPTLITDTNMKEYARILLDARRFTIEMSEKGMIDASQKFNEVIRKAAEELTVPFVDTDKLVPRTIEYFGDNVHYTNKGAEIVAKGLWDLIDRYALLREKAVESSHRFSRKKRVGDPRSVCRMSNGVGITNR